MQLPPINENLRKILISIFAGLTVLSFWFAHIAMKCHSYGRTPFRFTIDIFLRTLFIAMPFCLMTCTYGLWKNRPWAKRWVIYSYLMIFLETALLIIEMRT